MDLQIPLSEMITAMQEKAENAYLNGEIATARHLATVALEQWPDGAPLSRISWCFAILLHCYKNETDYVCIKNRYYVIDATIDGPQSTCRFSAEGTDDGQFISFLMELMAPSISPAMLERWRDTYMEMSAPTLKDDVSTALLVETVIESLCFFGLEEWHAVGEHLVSVLEPGHRYVSQEIKRYIQRLSIQMRLMKAEQVSEDELHSLRQEEQLLAHAWNAYFSSDFSRLDQLIPQMSAAFPCNSEYFLSLQSIVTATEFQRSIAREKEQTGKEQVVDQGGSSDIPNAVGYTVPKTAPQKEPAEKGGDRLEFARYYRYQRFETERPLSAFLALREANAKEIAHQLREKTLAKDGVASVYWDLFRMLPFLWSSALKYWDLSGLFQSYKLKMEFYWASALSFEDEEYCGYADETVDAIICGIQCMDSTHKRKDVKRLIGILEQYGSSNDIQRLYEFIFTEAPPVTWNLCVEWLRLLGDLLPKGQVHACIDWTVRYHERAGTLLTVLNSEEYYYLHPILQHYALTGEEHKSLMFHFERMFRCPPHEYGEFKTVLWYLAEHDWDTCRQLMENMVTWKEYDQAQAIVINCCAGLVHHYPKAKAFCVDLLNRRGKETGIEAYQKFALAAQEPQSAKVPDLGAVYTSFQEAIAKASESGYESRLFKKVLAHIEGFSWSEIGGEALHPILELTVPVVSGAKKVYPLYIVDVLRSLCLMFQSAADEAPAMLVDVLLENIEFFKCVFQPVEQKATARNAFRITFYRPEHLYNQVLYTFCQIYDKMTTAQKLGAIAYAQEGLYHFPQQAYYPTYLFLRTRMDDIALHPCADVGLAQLRILALHEKVWKNEVLTEILRGIQSAQELGENISEDVKPFVIAIVEIGADSYNHTNRLRAAQIAKLLPQDHLGNVLEKLKNDKRKSVRNAIAK